jgi:hypothetical protein
MYGGTPHRYHLSNMLGTPRIGGAMKLIVMTLALALGACTTGEQMGKLREGMSPAEVSGVLGSPNGQTRSGDYLQYQYTNRLVSGWGWDRADFYALFEDDKLTAWGSGDVRQNQPNIHTIVPLQPFAPVQ